MAELVTIARPYAEAAFRLAREEQALPQWSDMLKLCAAVVSDPKVHAALDDPKLTVAEKESLFLSVCGDKLSGGGKNFSRVLLEAERIALLPEISVLFDELKDNEEGVAQARIASAFPLSDSQLDDIKSALEKHFGKKIETSVMVDPALIGGARISVGDRVIDASVAGKLEVMANRLRA